MEINELAKALVALQGDLEPVNKTAENPFFKSKYADLPDVMQTLQPLLKKHKLAISQFPTSIGGEPALRIYLIHESGQYIEDVMPLKLAKQDPQGQGSALTYARRYSAMAVTGLVADEDDDGNSASMGRTKNEHTASQVADTTQFGTHPPTEKQIQTVKGMLVQLGVDKEKRDEIVEQVTTFQKASQLISELKEKVANKRANKEA